MGSLLLYACSPTINPKLRASVDAQLNQAKTSSQVYATDSVPAGFQAGQWVQYKNLDKDGKPSILTYKLLATSGDQHSIETVMESYYFRTVTYMDVRFDVNAPLESLEILRVVSKDEDEPPRQADSFQMSMLGSMYKSVARQVFLRQTPSDGISEVAVPAGVFEDCTQKETVLYLGPLRYKARSWHHPGVPIHGMVKAESVDSNSTNELIAFGLSGAQSEIVIGSAMQTRTGF